jgi:hypothetical protein
MNKRFQFFRPLLFGGLLALFPLGLAPSRLWAFAGPETCATCHADLYAQWENSLHAKAYKSERFQKSWSEHGKKSACLACHTTGHESGTSKFNHEGVTCESCHGELVDGHPGDGKMKIPISSDACQTCHRKTFQESLLSKHGKKGIRCFDCHQVHSQGLRQGGGDALCGSCHPKKMNDFTHSTHHKEGLKCVTCHMPRYGEKAGMIEGTGAPGHTLAVGADVCARCHEDRVHSSSSLPTLREQVTDFHQQMAVAGVENVFELNEQVKDLKWRLGRSQQSLWVTGLLAILVGLLLGWLGAWYLLRKR